MNSSICNLPTLPSRKPQLHQRLWIAMVAWVLPLLLLFSSAVVKADQSGDFSFTSNGTSITITGYTGTGGALNIPGMIGGLPVTSIGDSAFAIPQFGWPNIYSVTIPNSVTSIGDYAFSSSSRLSPSYLSNVYFQGNAPSAGGASIFAGNPYATAFYLAGTTGWGPKFGGAPATLWEPSIPCAYAINNGTITINRYMGSGGGTVTIPETINGMEVTRIGDHAFNTRATDVTSITLPNSITSIGTYAFNGCSSITSISIPNSVASMGDFAFSSCTNLTSVTIGTNITAIGYGVFSDCENLTSAIIAGSVTSLGHHAFESCTTLKGVYFWGNAPAIGSYVFNGDNELTIYRRVGTTGWGTTFDGFPVAIWDNLHPEVITQPSNRTACPGSTVLFTLAVGGPGPFAYQWRINGTNIDGATDAICAIKVQADSGGEYSVVVSNSWGSATSSNAVLTVNSSQAGVLGGTVTAWGEDYYGETVVPADLYNVVAIAAGSRHTLALRNDGSVAAWGYHHYGQTTVPAGLSNVVAIAAGWNHSVALRSDGTVVTWGYHAGAGSIPEGLNNVVAVAARGDHNLALLANSTVVAWGDNDCGQSTVPAGLSNVVAVAAGDLHSLALRADGTVVAWGQYFDYNDNLVPIYVPTGLQNVVAIAAGGDHSLALQADGTVVAWGDNSLVPARLGAVMSLAAGSYHSMALRADGTVIEWGGGGVMTRTPADLSNVVELAAGYAHSVALVAASGPSLPVITLQPIPTTILSIETATLAVKVTGPGPFSYQWYLGTSGDITQPLSGARKASYTTAPNTGNVSYWVRISNGSGAVNSNSALVSVINPSPDLSVATDNNLEWFTGGNSGYDYGMISGSGGNTHDGADAAASSISGGSTSYHYAWMRTTVTGPGILTFWWKFSSDIFIGSGGFDFQIDSVSQKQSGENWTKITHIIGAGDHTLEWGHWLQYLGNGTAFLDEVKFVPGNPSPEITVQQPVGKDLKDDVSSKSFGSVALKSTFTKTFTIRNAGTANLTGLTIRRSGANSKNFTVKPPLKTTLAPGASTTFKVTFKPSAEGNRKAVIHIKSNDSNESPFSIALTGKGVTTKKATPSIGRLPSSWSASGGSAWFVHDIRQSSGAMQLADGRRYLTLTVIKSPADFLTTRSVEVSPNLIDWYSGSKHTTVITGTASRLKVRDNTPLAPGTKRYIRLNQLRQ